MAKIKYKTNALKPKQDKKPRKDPRIEEIYEEEVEFICPVRGKIKQKVKVKRYKPLGEQSERHVIVGQDLTDVIEEKDDGLSIYNDGEDLGVSDKKDIE